MADQISFLCYSDIHHDEYKNGLTGEDVEAIEDEFTEKCKELEVDFWLFGGDRFVSRNPWDVSRLRADRALKRRNDRLKIPGVMIPGNHDQWTKNPYGGHSLTHLELFDLDLNRIHIIGQANSHLIKLQNGEQVAIHGVPAGQDPLNWQIDTKNWNLCLFHGMIKGSVYQNGVRAEDGIDPAVFDSAYFDMVIGGDNHKYQKLLGFSRTIAYYVGAPMQHNWGDAGSKRGFLYVKMDRTQSDMTELTVRQIQTKHPQFIKCETRIDDPTELGPFVGAIQDTWKDNIVSLVINGSSQGLSNISTYELSKKLKKETGARLITVKLQFDMDRVVVANATERRTDADEWNDFLKMQGPSAIGQLDPERLRKLGLEFIQDA